MRYAMIMDLDKCIGCHACEIACKAENLTPKGDFRCRLFKAEQERTPFETWLRLSCCHCSEPSCLPACPAKAISKLDNGLVSIDTDACIGCGRCIRACPYSAVTVSSGEYYFDTPMPYEELAEPHQVHPKGKADKCTFCAHLLAQGQLPACVTACCTNAVIFGDLDDPSSEIAKLWPQAMPLLISTGNGPALALIQHDDRHATVAEMEDAVRKAGKPNKSAGLV